MFSLPLSKEQTEFIIPQKQPFVLITSLIKADETGCETSFTTSENHLLLQGTRLSSCGIIKNIAQSCATMMGFVNAAQDSKPKVGFIIYTRSFQCSKLPGVKPSILPYKSIIRFSMLQLLRENSSLNGEQIASFKMKIFVKPEYAARQLIGFNWEAQQ